MNGPHNAPPPSECFPASTFHTRHTNLLNENRVRWAVRRRYQNGLMESGGVFETPLGTVLVHEPKFLQWLFGLSGKKKPRKLRGKSRRRSRAN